MVDYIMQEVLTIIENAAQEQLTELDLTNTGITEFPDTITQLTNLQSLHLMNNRLTTLPDSIAQLTNLQHLNLMNNRLTTLPDSIAQLTNLQSLDLSGNQLTTLPDSITQLTNLQSLNLDITQLTTLPDSITQLTNLQSLNLMNNHLTTLPDSIAQLTNLQSLDLSGNQLTTLPDSIAQLTNLQSLNLSNNQFNSLPDTIAQLTNLQYLVLSGNQLTTLPDSITQLTNLQYLVLMHNQFNSLPDSITQLANLQHLDLDGTQLNSLSDIITQLTNLQHLDLRNNYLTTLPDSIAQLTNLQSLHLINNHLTTLPDTIAQLTNLQHLSLSNNQLNSFPDAIIQLTNLQHLSLSNNQLNSLPDTIAQLTNLQHLDLSNNQLNSLPDVITQLINLESLDLSNNQLNSLPNTIAQLTNLESLVLSDNQLNSLPNTIAQLTNLESLDLSSNQLNSFPDAIIQLTSLESLYLSSNQLNSLPDTIAQLTNLQHLNLANNQFNSFPNTIAQLTNLKFLLLKNNQLNSLPDTIAQLTNLQHLDLSNNQFNSFPDAIAQLTNLKFLLLINNQLNSLPNTIAQLTNLQFLLLMNNQLTNLPIGLTHLGKLLLLQLDDNPLDPILKSVHEAGPAELMTYLRSLEYAKPLYEAKLILLGEGAVGKTTLLKALTGQEPRKDEPTTHGAKIDVAALSLPLMDAADNHIQLNAWDFGGQEIYRITHQFFFSPGSIYILVWEPRRGVNQCQVAEWLKLIRLRVGEKARVIIVSTHCKTGGHLAHNQIDRPAFRRDFGDMIVDFLEVDSMIEDNATGEKIGIAQLKSIIAKTARLLDHIGYLFNHEWYAAREDILRLGEYESLISYNKFTAICAQYSLNEVATRTLATLMHDLGYIVYYGADERLKDDVVLQPEWLTKAIGFVLEDRTTAEREGILPDDHLRSVWLEHEFQGEPHYEPHLYPFFLRLMEKYDVSYRLESGDASLVAQHVPQERPSLPWTPYDEPQDDKERIAMICVMDETPTGLVPWLIVRTHEYAYEHFSEDGQIHPLHWQTGIFLQNKSHGEALLELRGREFHIYTQATWPVYFMNILQATLEKLISDNWPGLQNRYKFTVPCPTQKPNGLPCTGRFDIIALQAFWKKGYNDFPCQDCHELLNIRDLLFGFDERDTHTQQFTEIKSQLAQGFDTMSQEFTALKSYIANYMMATMRAMANEAKDGPRLFTLEPTEGWSIHQLYSTQYQLHLWCEAEGCQHPVHERGKGIYTVKATHEWIQQIGPYVNFIAGVIKTILPIAAPTANLYFGQDIMNKKGWGDTLDLIKEATSNLVPKIESSDTPRDVLSDAERSGVLALHAFLRKEDPHHERLGLRRVPTYTGDYLWLCPKHYEATESKIPSVIK